MQKPAVFLIGMPGAGKSTLGVMLAKSLAKPFIDTDLLIQQRAGMTLQAFLDSEGFLALRALEQEVLLNEEFGDAVVATGGSVVYSDTGMQRLATLGQRVYLQISLPIMLERVKNQGDRGLACGPGTSLRALYEEREALYENCADITIELSACSPEQVLTQLLTLLPEEVDR